MKTYRQFISEDAPTNNAGGGQIDGIGVGPKGEPGVRRSKLLDRRNKLKRGKKNA